MSRKHYVSRHRSDVITMSVYEADQACIDYIIKLLISKQEKEVSSADLLSYFLISSNYMLIIDALLTGYDTRYKIQDVHY